MTYLTGVVGVGEVLGVASAGLLLLLLLVGCRCRPAGGGRPASIVCTRAAIHRRVVEHMDGRTGGRVVVVGDAVAHGLLLLLLLLLGLLLLLLVLRRRRPRRGRRRRQRRRGILHHRGGLALSEEPRDRVPHSTGWSGRSRRHPLQSTTIDRRDSLSSS